jgi:copper homeostasis protein
LEAQKGGADRIELCDNISAGGTTPSIGSILTSRKLLKIKIFVLIRPRAGDFLYSGVEYDIIKKDIKFCKEAHIDGIVTGVLNSSGGVDKKRLMEIVKLANPLPVTFHRAFDMTAEPFKAMEDIIECGCKRILTSGQMQTAEEGIKLISELAKKSRERIIIMPGSGINENNIKKIMKATKCDEFHMSLRKIISSKMKFRNENIKMGSNTDTSEYEIKITSAQRIRKIKNLISLI